MRILDDDDDGDADDDDADDDACETMMMLTIIAHNRTSNCLKLQRALDHWLRKLKC